MKALSFDFSYEEWDGGHDWAFFDQALKKGLAFAMGKKRARITFYWNNGAILHIIGIDCKKKHHYTARRKHGYRGGFI
jgi:hypothetical protein